MECKRCKEPGATRTEMHFSSNAIVVVYLCRKCADLAANDDAVRELVPTPSP